MDKRYQVFISSTYEDLKEERLEVIQALLELNCIPAGMELFPAADDDQWTLIKQVIDDCDYYVVIVGGRYGSISNSGISYTQKEYEYAISKDKPVISFTHRKPGNISADKTERTEEGKKKLEEFKSLVRRKMCKDWETPAELGSVVSRSLMMLIKNKPAIGWVKADLVPDESASQEILKLRNKIEKLEEELKNFQILTSIEMENLSEGNDEIEIKYEANIEIGRREESLIRKNVNETLFTDWNYLFNTIAPGMIWEETSEDSIKETIEKMIEDDERDYIISRNQEEGFSTIIHRTIVSQRDFEKVMIQFWALGYIQKSSRTRHWTLTPIGLKFMFENQTIKKNEVNVSEKEAD